MRGALFDESGVRCFTATPSAMALAAERGRICSMQGRDHGRALVCEVLTMSEETADKINNAEGVVKWFDPRKGFGFLIGPSGQDIFVHFSAIQGDGFRVLKDGSNVLYDAIKSDKGWHATRVQRRDAVEVNVVQRHGYVRSPRR